MIFLYVLLFIAYGVLAWFKPKYALFLLLGLLPTYQIRFQILNIPVTLLEAMILILFVVYLVRNTKEIIKIVKEIGPWKWLIIAWLIIATIAVFVAPDLRSAAGIWKAYFIEPVLLLIVFLALIRNKKDLTLALSALIFSAFYISVWAIAQKFFGGGVWSTEVWGQPKIWRATGPFPHPNFLGLFIGPIFLLGLGQIIFHFRKKFWFIVYSLLFILLALLSLIFARSEGALLGVFVGLVFLGLIYKPIRHWTLIGLIILFLIITSWSGPRDYILQKSTFSDLSGQLRVNIWDGAITLIKHNPILGTGLSGYQKLIPDYQKRFYDSETKELISVETHPYPHNIFLGMWLELGLIGLIVFFWILIKFFCDGLIVFKGKLLKGVKNIRENILYSSTTAAILVIVIHGLVDTPYFKNDLSVLFWLLIGFIIVLRRGTEVVITASPRKRLVP